MLVAQRSSVSIAQKMIKDAKFFFHHSVNVFMFFFFLLASVLWIDLHFYSFDRTRATVWLFLIAFLLFIISGFFVINSVIKNFKGRYFLRILVPINLAICIIAMISTYGYIYSIVGIQASTRQLDSLDYIYFSFCTWTTVGYGDITPVKDARLLAGSEALLGYLSIPAIISLFTSAFKD